MVSKQKVMEINIKNPTDQTYGNPLNSIKRAI